MSEVSKPHSELLRIKVYRWGFYLLGMDPRQVAIYGGLGGSILAHTPWPKVSNQDRSPHDE